MIYLTADLHLGHANIIRYCDRPFSDIDEMDKTLIANWNRTVHKEDTVYVLGDFSFGSLRQAIKYIEQLKGAIYFLRGSHDKWLSGFKVDERIIENSWYSGFLIQIPGIQSGTYNLPTTLCHYAMRKWAQSHYGAAHFFGHSHGKLEPLGRSFDVGVDAHHYYPVQYDYALDIVSRIRPHDKIESDKS